MKKKKIKKNHLRFQRFHIIFLITFTGALLITSYIQKINAQQKYERAEYLAHTIGSETYEMILSQLSKTRALEAYLIESDGCLDGSEEIANMFLNDEGVRNILFAPDGIVEVVYPLERNEEVLGLNMYEDGLGNWEARAAIAEKELYMAGPFELLQGGIGIAGRLPVFLQNANGHYYFWGIVSLTLDFPQILENSSIQYLNDQGYACEIWRIMPDTSEHQTILETPLPVKDELNGYNYELSMFHAEWNITVSPLKAWYEEVDFWICILLSLLISFLASMTTYNRDKLRVLEQKEAARQIEYLKQQVEYEQSNMLLSQIRSHFFYHTLNSLQALIILEPDNAYKMVDDFSRYMRFNLDSITIENGICTFKEELKSVKAYTDINQKQLGDRLTLNYDLPDIDFNIPVLTIQPIVENAILHGIKPKVGGGTITVSLKVLDKYMKVTIEDDGVGFEMNEEVFKKSVGMKNVKRRLSQFEGCSISIQSQPSYGTKVVLLYPKNL
ncbi:MAG: histidine kinase [Schaedlerella sp.]|nr:histidine kinase [Schaedlerella sp.]